MYAYSMTKNRIITVVVVLVLIALGYGAVKTFDTSTVVHTDCVVTDTQTHFRSVKQGGNTYSIKTENCGNLKSTYSTMDEVEVGGTYDLTATGIFSWGKMVTSVEAK